MTGEPVTKTFASAKDISRIVGAMNEVFSDESPADMFMACLSISILLQCPDIELDQLRDGVLGASEWIALFVSSIDEANAGGIEPSKVN